MNITECDLRVTVGPFSFGPGRLATQLLSPLPGFEIILGPQPFLSLSTRVSSSEVFLVDERTWSLSSKKVKALSHASGSDYVYAVTEDEVSENISPGTCIHSKAVF